VNCYFSSVVLAQYLETQRINFRKEKNKRTVESDEARQKLKREAHINSLADD
jgi:hypothetical protein